MIWRAPLDPRDSVTIAGEITVGSSRGRRRCYVMQRRHLARRCGDQRAQSRPRHGPQPCVNLPSGPTARASQATRKSSGSPCTRELCAQKARGGGGVRVCGDAPHAARSSFEGSGPGSTRTTTSLSTSSRTLWISSLMVVDTPDACCLSVGSRRWDVCGRRGDGDGAVGLRPESVAHVTRVDREFWGCW